MSQSPAGAFRRYNETPDERFYSIPRLVAHINAPNYRTPRTTIPRSTDQARHQAGVNDGLNHSDYHSTFTSFSLE